MHWPFIPPATAAGKIAGALMGFAHCRLKISVQWTHKAGRQASLLFPLILGEGCLQVNYWAHSGIYDTAAELQNSMRSAELIWQIHFWIYFFKMWSKPTCICSLQSCQQVLLVLPVPSPAVSILHRSHVGTGLGFASAAVLCSSCVPSSGKIPSQYTWRLHISHAKTLIKITALSEERNFALHLKCVI